MRNTRNTNIVGEGKKKNKKKERKKKRVRINITCYWVTWKSTRVSSDTVYNFSQFTADLREIWSLNDKNVGERVIDLDRTTHKFRIVFELRLLFRIHPNYERNDRRRRITVSNKSIISLGRGIKPRSKLQRVATSGQGCVCIFSVRQSGAISSERILNINHIDFWIWIGKLYLHSAIFFHDF